MSFDLPPLDAIVLPPLTLDGDLILPPLEALAEAPQANGRLAQPVKGERDWFVVPWDEVGPRTGLAPGTVPGVRTATNHPVAQLAPPRAAEYARQAGASARPPHPYRVHRSHLPVLSYTPPASGLLLDVEAPHVLRPHQERGVRFIRDRRGALLADEMRCGKTAQVVYAHEEEHGPLVVVGPTAARAVWHEWVARRFGACPEDGCSICARAGAVVQTIRPTFVSLQGRTPDLGALRLGARVYFLTYATIGPWSEQFAAFGRIGTLAVDEAHLAGVQHRRNITVIGIKRLNTAAYRCVMLSGTPLWNKPNGLWPIVDTICPAAFGDYWSYAIRYSAAAPSGHGWSANGVSNERELEQRLSAVMLRRTWGEIQPNLLPINRTIEYVELSEHDHARVFELAAELRKQVTIAGKAQTVVGNLERLRRLYASYKVDRAVEIVRQTMAAGHNVVAWTWHRDVARALAAAFEGDIRVFGPIHGDLSPGAREQILEEVRGYDRPRVLIATMGALATAVSLNWASHEVMTELDWTPANHLQAEYRPYDGTRPISVTYLVADCDPDRRQGDALLTKLEAQAALRLSSGSGDVSQVLASTLAVAPGGTLDAVASLILAAETI